MLVRIASHVAIPQALNEKFSLSEAPAVHQGELGVVLGVEAKALSQLVSKFVGGAKRKTRRHAWRWLASAVKRGSSGVGISYQS